MIRPVRRFLRRIAAQAGGWLLRVPAPLGAPAPSEVRKILVIRVDDRVGNVLLTTPLLAALQSALPKAEIHVLVAPKKRALVEGLAQPIDFDRRDLVRRPARFFGALASIRSAGYQVAIDASHWHDFSLTSALLLAWTRAPIRIAHARGEAHRYATHLVASGGAEPELNAKLRLLAPLAIVPEPGIELVTHLGQKGRAADRMQAWLEEQGLLGAKLVGIAPGARKADHRLPADVFAELGRDVARAKCVPIVLWGPDEETLAAEVARAAGAKLAPPTDIEELAALMRRLSAVVTNDTGPMHLAVACGLPTIALFVRSDPVRWGHGAFPNAVIPADGRPASEVLEEARRALGRVLERSA